jgi:hypothetical protein
MIHIGAQRHSQSLSVPVERKTVPRLSLALRTLQPRPGASTPRPSFPCHGPDVARRNGRGRGVR